MSVNDGLDPDRTDDEPRKNRDREKPVPDREIIVNEEDTKFLRKDRRAHELAGYDLDNKEHFETKIEALRRQKEAIEARRRRGGWLAKFLLIIVTTVIGAVGSGIPALVREAAEWLRSFVR